MGAIFFSTIVAHGSRTADGSAHRTEHGKKTVHYIRTVHVPRMFSFQQVESGEAVDEAGQMEANPSQIINHEG